MAQLFEHLFAWLLVAKSITRAHQNRIRHIWVKPCFHILLPWIYMFLGQFTYMVQNWP
jgi:hypothetical protein